MNQDSSMNNIPAPQNIRRTITNADVQPKSKKTQKTNLILKMNLILSAYNLQIKTNK